LIDISQIRDLTLRTLTKLGPKYASSDAIDLLIGTAIIESRFKYIKQLGDGPANGFWQIESDTALDNNTNWLRFRPKTLSSCVSATYVPLRYWAKGTKNEWNFLLRTNLAAGIVHARIKYYRVPHPIPKTLEGQAKYWKQWYNTELGAGDPEEYIDQVSKYL
tara:strand:+ start:3409 stop:3894 length:486 start_codon:yes stop_codon:yes gene_type:complete